MARLAALMVAALLVGVVSLVSAAHAQTGSAVVEVTVGSSDITVSLAEIITTVGAMELTIVGVPGLDGECVLNEGLGACSGTGDRIEFVALNPVGWSDSSVLTTIPLAGRPAPDEVQATLGKVTDVSGVDIAATTRVIAGPEAAQGGVPALVIVAAVALVIALCVVAWLKRSRNVA